MCVLLQCSGPMLVCVLLQYMGPVLESMWLQCMGPMLVSTAGLQYAVYQKVLQFGFAFLFKIIKICI